MIHSLGGIIQRGGYLFLILTDPSSILHNGYLCFYQYLCFYHWFGFPKLSALNVSSRSRNLPHTLSYMYQWIVCMMYCGHMASCSNTHVIIEIFFSSYHYHIIGQIFLDNWHEWLAKSAWQLTSALCMFFKLFDWKWPKWRVQDSDGPKHLFPLVNHIRLSWQSVLMAVLVDKPALSKGEMMYCTPWGTPNSLAVRASAYQPQGSEFKARPDPNIYFTASSLSDNVGFLQTFMTNVLLEH
jgi:hypothetical protein